MENRIDSSYKTSNEPVKIFIEQELLAELLKTDTDLSTFQFTNEQDSQVAFHKKDNRIWIRFENGTFCDFPYYLKNLRHFLTGLTPVATNREDNLEFYQAPLRYCENLEQKILNQVNISAESTGKTVWSEIIKKLNQITAQTHSLQDLASKILEMSFLKNFGSCLFMLHLKGQTRATLLGTNWGNRYQNSSISVRDYNSFFNSVKKSKTRTYSSDLLSQMNVPLSGTFLAHHSTSMKFSLISIATRHDFLNYGDDEINHFDTVIELLLPHIEKIIDQEFSNKNTSELRMCLKHFPLPLRIRTDGHDQFTNDFFTPELTEQDVIFSKKIANHLSFDVFDSDELRHYAFDLFHFQRISLLGDLLNTLRHELSNPLFGLKLGSQMFCLIDADQDNQVMMKEIEKNINRCQSIIENFSNLYRITDNEGSTNTSKVIDEALILAKSELRDVKKELVYEPDTRDLTLNIPAIFMIQILFNLFVNAAQAMRGKTERPNLNIHVRRTGNQIEITIHDNGPGIDEASAKQLFKPFYTTKANGTGLGLVLSRNLANKMGGKLDYVFEPHQTGAKFRLELPIL